MAAVPCAARRIWRASSCGVAGKPSGASFPRSAFVVDACGSVAWYASLEELSYAHTCVPLWIRLYSAAGWMMEIFCRSGPSAATCRVWLPTSNCTNWRCGSAREVSGEPSAGGAAAPPNTLLPVVPDSREGSPRSVLNFTVPSTVRVSDAAILASNCSAVSLGKEGSPLSASAGTRLIVAAVTPTTATGTAYRSALRPRRRPPGSGS